MIDLWKKSPQFKKVLEILKTQNTVTLSGLTDSALSSFIASVYRKVKLNIVVVVDKERDISNWCADIGSFTGTGTDSVPLLFPSDYGAIQIDTLKKITSADYSIVIGTLQSISEKILSPAEFSKKSLKIKKDTIQYSEINTALMDGEYVRVDVVGEKGEFARRGEIIDFWTPSDKKPIRILFDIQKISEIKYFDPFSQRSIKSCDNAEIIPARHSENAASYLKDYLKKNFIVFFTEDNCENKLFLPQTPKCINRVKVQKSDIDFTTREFYYARSFHDVKGDLDRLKSSWRIILTAANKTELDKVIELVKSESRPTLNIEPMVSYLRNGFISQENKLSVITISDILGYHKSLLPRAPQPVRPVEEFSDIKAGDYVVHKKFGIGLFEGMKKMTHNQNVSDFLQIKYGGSGRLYVAVENADLIQKYIGSRWDTKLDSLSGRTFSQRTRIVRESVKILSKKLVKLYIASSQKGTSFEPHPEIEKEFADYFPYKLTRHQEEAVRDTLRDMESQNAMDRLICGDVGFGKTEVCMRAAFRAVLNGRQVVLLAPTTLLARQHFHSFRERFSNFPVFIEMISRLVPQVEQKRIIQKISSGLVDITIGTHRILSESFKFPSLGLIIVDEEQRFGVEQKEKIRFKHKSVDILTTTATPIPRTLSMAMGQVKGFSLINTPPPGRLSVETKVLQYDFNVLKNAILNEKLRGGQCYVVHSRVSSIDKLKNDLKENIKGVSFESIHGRLDPEKIDHIMDRFIRGEFDCLISTTIIENGLDIPSVNTMIVDFAHRMGLADIYQLRGRIGRSSIKAYCYLMYPEYLNLTEHMKDRLGALKSFSDLGSGFQLALRDLQLRGAGELLGPRQHGNIMKIGFDRYSSILKQELAKVRGEEYVEPPDVEITLPISAFIPDDYINSSELRLSFYRKLSSVSHEKELSEIKDELKDRFGKTPVELAHLTDIIYIKIMAARAKIASISFSDSKVLFKSINGEIQKVEIKGRNILSEVKREIKTIILRK